MRAGVVVKLPAGPGAAVLGAVARGGIEPGGLAFVDAREVRAIVLPEVVRLLGEAAGARVGVAVVEGKVLAAFDVASRPEPSLGAALVVASEGRGEAFVALGLEIVETGSFDGGADADVVAIAGQPVPVVSLVAAFRSIDAAAWAAHGAVGLGAVGLGAVGLGPAVDVTRGGAP